MTEPIKKLEISWGRTTDKLKIPIKNPILLLSTFSDMIANGRLTTAAHPRVRMTIMEYKVKASLAKSTIPKYSNKKNLTS